jgi:hypothetical protein
MASRRSTTANETEKAMETGMKKETAMANGIGSLCVSPHRAPRVQGTPNAAPARSTAIPNVDARGSEACRARNLGRAVSHLRRKGANAEGRTRSAGWTRSPSDARSRWPVAPHGGARRICPRTCRLDRAPSRADGRRNARSCPSPAFAAATNARTQGALEVCAVLRPSRPLPVRRLASPFAPVDYSSSSRCLCCPSRISLFLVLRFRIRPRLRLRLCLLRLRLYFLFVDPLPPPRSRPPPPFPSPRIAAAVGGAGLCCHLHRLPPVRRGGWCGVATDRAAEGAGSAAGASPVLPRRAREEGWGARRLRRPARVSS